MLLFGPTEAAIKLCQQAKSHGEDQAACAYYCCGKQGQAADIAIHAEEILYLRKELNRLYHHHTNQSLDTLGEQPHASQ